MAGFSLPENVPDAPSRRHGGLAKPIGREQEKIQSSSRQIAVLEVEDPARESRPGVRSEPEGILAGGGIVCVDGRATPGAHDAPELREHAGDPRNRSGDSDLCSEGEDAPERSVRNPEVEHVHHRRVSHAAVTRCPYRVWAHVDRERSVALLESDRVPARATADIEHRATEEPVALVHDRTRIGGVAEVVLPDVSDLGAVPVHVSEVAALVPPLLVVVHCAPERIRPVHAHEWVSQE